MTLAGQVVAFVLGLALSIRMIAALYAIIDFWYAIGTLYPRVVRGILGWGVGIVAIGWLLSPPLRAAFALGLLAFPLFYSSLFVLRHPVLRALQRRASRESRPL